ncbi:SLBB domain-containing protein [Telmatobacter sp. DSM 110680]|uniref:SLBB domain-containing protein n=1 Tax=Telmatobacter sp. DSM 110680 TaxID=3036704 RepID=A0AAU7DEI9_9BACT
MTFRKLILLLASLLLMRPNLVVAQEQRPALIPLAQGGGASSAGASASSVASIGGLSDSPIAPGEVVHINVFDAPDFSLVTRVSETGDVPYPILGSFHIGGLNSASAARMLAKELKDHNLMLEPEITVTVDSSSTGITVLGEVHSPGVYPPPGKHQLSDLLAIAGGLTSNTGRIIEITNDRDAGKKDYVSWDPTMHNTENFDRAVSPGDRVLVRACGIAYVGGNVSKPGAYSLCGSPRITLSELMALAGGVTPNASYSKTYLVRAQPDGTKVVEQIDVKAVLTSRVSDPIVQEDDIIYVSPSPLKAILKNAVSFALAISPQLFYTYHP